MEWIDVTNLNKKWSEAWMAGLGDAGVFGGGNVLQPKQAPAGLGQAALTFSQIQTLQDLLNVENDYRKRDPIPVTGVMDYATCLTIAFYVKLLHAGEKVDGFLYDMLFNWEAEIASACAAPAAAQPAPGPAPSPPQTVLPGPGPAPISPEPTSPTLIEGTTCFNWPDGAMTCDCFVDEGDRGLHIANLQQQLNEALVAKDYEPIVVTGNYDKETCGAIYELGGSFSPSYPGVCNNPEGEWIVPLQCPDMVLPKKKGGGSRAGMFAIGGLLLAAGVGGAYWMTQR